MTSSPLGNTILPDISGQYRSNVELSPADGGNPPRASTTTATPKRSDLLRAALGYAEAGLPVLPCKPGRKEPLTRNGHKDATTNRQQIIAWWNRWPEANIGVPTGECSGWLVLDQDHPSAMDTLEEDHGALPATRTHGTGSGGIHYVFSYPEGSGIRNSAGRLAEHLDVRGEGGYVVVPPSATERPYELLDDLPLADAPAWLLEALSAPRKASAEDRRREDRLAVLDSGPIPRHRRNDTLTSIAGRLHDGTRDLARLTADLMDVRDRRCEDPAGFPDTEVAKIAASIHRRVPCRPQGKRTPEDVQRALLVFERKLEAMTWSGHASNRLSLLKTYILLARKHGEVREDGVAISCSNSQAALRNSVSLASVKRGKAKLVEGNLIRVDNEGRNPTDSATVILLIPASEQLDNRPEPGCEPTHHPPGGVVGEDATRQRQQVEGGRLGSQRGWSATRARHGKPLFDGGEMVGYLGRMGKRAEFAVDRLEEAGGRLSQRELADAMGVKRPRNMNTSMWLSRLLDAGVVERDGEGYLALTDEWLAAWDRRRVEDEEDLDRVRDQARYKRMSEAWAARVAETEERLRARRLERVALACFDGEFPVEADGFIGELEPVQEAAHGPAEAELLVGAGDAPAVQEIPQAVRTHDAHPSELAGALASYLALNPGRSNESPSWLGVALWAEGYTEGKPDPPDVAAALGELGRLGREEAA